MIETETVIPRVARPQARALSTGIRSGVESDETPTMKAIYLEKKAGAEGLVAGEIPRPNPKEDGVLIKVRALRSALDRAKDQARARKTAILQYAALGHPILSAYRTHCTCQVKFLMK